MTLLLLVISQAALALGLGEIRVKSQPGQPLLAEIPVISSAPGELEQLRARLASPVIFERVGLQRPSGLVSQLDFAVALSSEGKPVIRVTSQEAVETRSVNFLIEVDWGQGRLVREYSALVGAPGTLAAAGQARIQAPAKAPSSRIDRDVAPAASAPAGLEASTDTPATATAIAAAPAPRAASPMAGASGVVTVQAGQSLSQIARGVGQGGSLNQAMIALLQANPEAFIGGNINRLRSGAVLHIPQAADISTLAASEAAAMVHQQAAEWRQPRAPVPQPAAEAALAQTAAQSPTPAASQAQARLEIAPPAAEAAERSDTRSGTEAGAGGDMLANQQLRQAKEDLAARSAEVQELKAQVAELEKLKAQQARLIALKDSNLAAAQQRVGEAQGGPAVQVWLWLGLVLVVVGLLAWVLARRGRAQAKPPVYQGALPDVAESADGAPLPPRAPVVDQDWTPVEPQSLIEPLQDTPVQRSGQATPTPADAPAPQAATLDWVSAPAKPTWHTDDLPRAAVTPAAMAATTVITEPSQPPVVRPPVQADPTPASAPSAGSRERLELAIAYLDLGDTEAARSLLQQVAASDDLAAREEATKLLNGLG